MHRSKANASFWTHIEELRLTIIRCFLFIGIGIILSFVFYDTLFAILTSPIKNIHHHSHLLTRKSVKRERILNQGNVEQSYRLPPSSHYILASQNVHQVSDNTYILPPNGYIEMETLISPMELVMMGPIEGMLITMKVCIWAGVALASPFWTFYLFRFIAPAFGVQDRKILLSFTLLSFVFVIAGLLLAYFVTIPIANEYLYQFNQALGTNLWTLSHYLSYVITLLLANAFAFEMCVCLLCLVHFNLISAKSMAAKRRHMIVAAFIIAAVLTPPDILTQFMLAIPLILLYEIAIIYAKIRLKRQSKTNHSSEMVT